MEIFKKNKNYVIIGITGLFSFLSYFLFKRFRKNHLPLNFINRCKDIKAKYDALEKKELNEEIVFTVLNIFVDVADYFYFRDHAYLENLRLACLDYPEHEAEYRDLSVESMQYQHESMERARRIISQLTGFNISKIEEFKNKSKGNHKDLMNKYRVRKDDTPKIERNIVKEAYIYYTDEYFRFTHESERKMMECQADPQRQHEYFEFHVNESYKIKDRLKERYSIDDRFIEDLLDVHNLREDIEIKFKIERMRQISLMKQKSLKPATNEEPLENH